MADTNSVPFLTALTASLVVIVGPGPDNILVLTRGVAQGRSAALVSAAGASLGLVATRASPCSGGEGPIPLRKDFSQAVTSNVLNPKIAVLFLTYLPQFADPATGGTALQLLALGLVFALLTLAIFSAIAVFSGTVGSWLRARPTFADGLSWLTGGVLILLGFRLALQERR